MNTYKEFIDFVIEVKDMQGNFLGKMSVNQFMYGMAASKNESVADVIKRYNAVMDQKAELVMRAKEV